ncbi:triadin-like [Ptychodera flava]|uniref:triadin-like n=1 Tax=Ptychodera flava TaxID=63121 RepID=UPI00396A6FDA
MGKNKQKAEKRQAEESSESEGYSSSSESDSDDALSTKRVKLDAHAKKQKKEEEKKRKKKEKLKAQGKITEEDFYNKGLEFRTWLVEEKGKYVDELQTSKAKLLFKKFVKKWNKHRLPKKYYKGFDASDISAASRTKYKWNFKGSSEVNKIQTVRGKIKSWTSGSNVSLHDNPQFSTFGKQGGDSRTAGPSKHVQGPALPPGSNRPVQGPALPPGSRRPVVGPTLPPGMDRPVQGPSMLPPRSQFELEEQQEADRRRLQKERKDFRSHDKMVMEELAPKATGHDAKIEKKLSRSFERKQRGQSPEMKDSYIMGGNDDFHARLHKRKIRQEEKRQADSEKISDYQAKEKAKMAALLEVARANRSENSLWKS